MSFIFLFIDFFLIKLIISTPSCKDNTNYCKTCNFITNICQKCENPEIYIPDENGGCVGAKKCVLGKNFCLECELDGSLCKKCEENYYRDENGGCTYSEGCEISYLGECLKCKEGFILVGSKYGFKFCKSLSIENYKKCAKINYETGLCEECEEGYYLTSKDNKCIKTENCKETIFGNCISCNDGYYYYKKEDKCEVKIDNFKYCKQSLDNKTSEICDDDYYLDENGICVETHHCSESEYDTCKKCKKGYYLSSNNICTNIENCDIVHKETSICLYCKKNYYLDKKDYTCKSNGENNHFKYCQEALFNQCIKCENNYYLDEDFKCTNSPNCIESENGVCKTCEKYFHLDLNNICINIDKCIKTNNGFCIECEDGYYYNKYNGTCLKMHDNFMNCKITCDYGDKCCECKDNFYLYEFDNLCYDNTKEENFIKCAHVNINETCDSCHDGYYLGSEDNKCCKVEKCKIVKNENTCFECEPFYCLDVKKQECVDNDYLEDINNKIYISCNRTNKEGTACEECIEGYEVNEKGFCVDIDYCEEKKDGKCVKCKDILSKNQYEFCANEIFGCLESAKYNCLQCNNLENLYECTECKEGYKNTILGCIKTD